MGFLNTSSCPRFATRAFAATLVAATFCLGPVASAADRLTDGSQPAVVVTVGSLNKLMKDTNYVSGVVGQPQVGGMFAMMVGGFAQGLDMDTPIAVFVSLAGGVPQPIAAIPTKDIRPVLKRLEAQTGPIDELDDGTLVVTVNRNTVYIKQMSNVAAAAQSREALALLPDDPSGMYQGMGNAYDIAARLKIQQIPAPLRNMFLDSMRQGMMQSLNQQDDGAEAARAAAESSLEQFEMIIQEADELNIGINVDESGRGIKLDVSFTALGGSNLAAIYGGQQSIPSSFASVIRDDAAVYFHSASSISEEAIEASRTNMASSMAMIKGMINSNGQLSDADLEEVDGFLSRLSEIVLESVGEGKSDVGGLFTTNEDTFEFVMGMFVADGGKVAALAQDLAQKVDGPQPQFKFNVGKYGGVDMHLIEGDVPASQDEARRVFGDKLQIYIGTGPKAVYVAVGRNSADALKKLIDAAGQDSSTDRPLGQFKLRLLPILQFAQSIEANDGVASVINALSGTDDKGEVSFVVDSVPNGSKFSMTIAEGILKAIGAAAQMGQQPGQFQPQPF